MKGFVKLHTAAMKAMDRYDSARRSGRSSAARKALLLAFDSEKRAAESAPDREPTRTVLFRSAATIALEAGLPSDARALIADGLAGSPPPGLKAELLALLKGPSYAPEGLPPVDCQVPKGTLVQRIMIRCGSSGSARVPFSLVTKVQERWMAFFKDLLGPSGTDAKFELLQAVTGSSSADVAIRASDTAAKAALDAFAHIGDWDAFSAPIDSRDELRKSRSFISVVAALADSHSRLEVRLYRAGDYAPGSTISLSPPAQAVLVKLHRKNLEFVDSDDIPQADSLAKVFTFVDLVNNGEWPDSESLGVVGRQVNYYRRAAEILGYVSRDRTLTVAGMRLAAAPGDAEKHRNVLVQLEASNVGGAWAIYSRKSSLSEVSPDSASKFLEARSRGLSTGPKGTIGRRAKSLASWLRKMQDSS